MPPRRTECALAIATAHCPVGARGLLIGSRCNHPIHAYGGVQICCVAVPTCRANMACPRQSTRNVTHR